MENFSARVFAQYVRTVHTTEWVAALAEREKAGTTLVEADEATLSGFIQAADSIVSFFGLSVASAKLATVKNLIKARGTATDLQMRVGVLRETLEEELDSRLVYFMPPARAVRYLAGPQMLDALGKTLVLDAFPDLATDIDEAGKCFGTGRFTACVFHLMRVMERGVGEFGKLLGLTITQESEWATILNTVDAKVDAMPKSDKTRQQIAETSSLLHAVKLAWRNPAMHPKATYTEEEANRIIEAVSTYMRDLADLKKQLAPKP